jgi:hypothetical protein
MGWVSFLEDIEKRLDDATVRLSSPPDVKPGSISVESLRDTNDLLRMKNVELTKLLYAVKMDISSKKKQPDFCKGECVRLRQSNDRLLRELETHKNDKTLLAPTSKNEATAPHQPEKTGLTSQHLREAKQRFLDAGKVVEAAKRDLKQAEKLRTRAQNEYQGLLQSERNSTGYVHDTGHIHSQRQPTNRSPR